METRGKDTGSAVQRALAYLGANLERETWLAGRPLPSTRHLAATIGVSRYAILKAIAKLKSKGLINGTQRSRIRSGTDPLVIAPATESANAVWLLKRTELEKDILSGLYAHQKGLPSLKELQARYGTCFVTMRKILRSMVVDGVVQLRGKKYEVRSYSNRSGQARIVFITYDSPTPPMSALNNGEYRVLDQLEQESMRRGLKPEIVEVDFYNSVETRQAAAGPAINAPALGYILDIWWYPNEEFRRSYFDLLTRLSASKKPVAILDEFGDFVLPLPFAANPLIQVFRVEGKKAGARVARLLLGMGHRSVAYISSVHENLWSQQRFEGVLEQFSRAGCGPGVIPVVGEKMEPTHEDAFALSGLDDARIRAILSMSFSKSLAKEMFERFAQHRRTAVLPPLKPGVTREIRNNLGIVSDMVQRKPRKSIFNRVTNEVFIASGTIMASASQASLFDRALALPGVTAWICASDSIALTALLFLSERGIKVPRELSVAGFDNKPVEALEHRLTTFDFNTTGFAHGMLNFIARPPKPSGPYRHVPIDVEGIVMQRETIAAPQRLATSVEG